MGRGGKQGKERKEWEEGGKRDVDKREGDKRKGGRREVGSGGSERCRGRKEGRTGGRTDGRREGRGGGGKEARMNVKGVDVVI